MFFSYVCSIWCVILCLLHEISAENLLRMKLLPGHGTKHKFDLSFASSEAGLSSNRVGDFEPRNLLKKIVQPIYQDWLIVNTTIGTPPQNFQMEVFIGSSFPTCIVSIQCKSTSYKGPRYNHSSSTTYIEDGRKYDDETTNIKGFVSKDRLCLTENCAASLPFVEVVDFGELRSNGDYDSDGIIGLFPIEDPESPQMPSILQQLYEEKKISNQIFSLWSNWNRSSTLRGELILGGVDEQLFIKPIIWTPLNENGIQLLDINVDKIVLDNIDLCLSGCEVIMNSMPGIFGPPSDIDTINDRLGADCSALPSAMCTVPCENIASIPSINVLIEGHPFELSPIDYIVKEIEKKTCYSAFVPMPLFGTWIIGRSFIERYYTIVDLEKKMVGFAKNQQL